MDSFMPNDFIRYEEEIPCSDVNGCIQGTAKIRDESDLNGTLRVKLDFTGRINPDAKDEMMEELKGFIKKFYL